MTRERQIPVGAVKGEHKTCAAVAYLYDAFDMPFAIGYAGKAVKPTFYHRFRSAEQRAKFVEEFMEKQAVIGAAKAAHKAEAKKPHGWQVGQILVASWGYEQTNIDFYQIVELVGASFVVVREIAGKIVRSSDAGSDYVVAVPGQFVGKPEKRKAQHGRIALESYKRAYPWDGKERYQTAAGWGH